MSNYNEQSVTGTEWTRCKRIVISNPLAAQPEIRYDEETVLTTSAGQTLKSAQGYLTVPFDPSAVIDLYDPATGQPTGQTVTQGEIYALVYSAYLTAANARDVANTPPAEEPIEEPQGE
ncbi:hypothetical protein [Pseudohongiella spirulinae]|uniref:Uncharacterized protein n=1 Tax=Pseudohongiella spirulinae TaxID=1249552 RepID=A0A0S2KE22_9GAMM|nr:hypothetical protein [Pseudohongiella spirulinae]ALO46566.1 hypothetical protein PS2015_1919 [Pseudohongiella spirulinae]